MPDIFEEKKLKETRDFIDKKINELLSEIEKKRESIRERNREFIADNPFGAVYGLAEETRRNNESDLERAEKSRAEALIFRKMKKEPYFGRVDFFYDDEEDEEKIYIGLKNLMDGRNILVYDWRAPISSLFYMGELGRASYFAPLGEITGEIRLLRQYNYTERGEVRYWDAELHIDDDVLRNVLSGASAEKMRPIVCTIQREQNAAIRYSSKKNLAVFGPAGCGKTSIGMHRLAWLMYSAHTEGYAVSTLMCTSNKAFASYISGVLPELGEVNTALFSFFDLFERYLSGYKIESALSQNENVIMGNSERIKNINMLYSHEFCDFVHKKLSEPSGAFKTVSVLGEVVLKKEVIEQKFKVLSKNSSIRERLESLADWVQEELSNYMLINRKNILAHLLEHLSPGESYTENYSRLKKQVLEKSRQMVFSAVQSDPSALFIRLLREFYGEKDAVRSLILRIGSRELLFEEGIALLYISVLLGNCKPFCAPTHVLIDEAQDMCALQHKIIRLLFPKASFTVLGDINQGIAPEINTLSSEKIAEIYSAQMMFMTKSYRSTRQISEFSKKYLPEGSADYDIFNREGKSVSFVDTDNAEKTSAEIIKKQSGKEGATCIILKTVDEARSFYKKIKSIIPNAQLIDTEDKAIDESILVMPAALTKGLEFDRVILPINKSAPPTNRLMYLMSTRALHELYVVKFFL